MGGLELRVGPRGRSAVACGRFRAAWRKLDMAGILVFGLTSTPKDAVGLQAYRYSCIAKVAPVIATSKFASIHYMQMISSHPP